LTVFSIPITLGAGGGTLFMGLFFGWYQSKHPNIGQIPSSARWFLKSVGLNAFIAVVGLSAGASFVGALQSMGYMILVIGALLSVVPHLISLYFGKYVLKLDAIDIIGGQCGAGTVTAALNAVTDETGSSIFALSYTPEYAVGNVLLTAVIGPLVVALLA
jgi:putative transport protein